MLKHSIILLAILLFTTLEINCSSFNVQKLNHVKLNTAQQSFCMPPISSFKQDVYTITKHYHNDISTFKYKSITKFNIIEGLKRVDTIDESNILVTEYIQVDYKNKNVTYAYTVEEGQCTCLNIGQPYDMNQLFGQCIDEYTNVEKINIANLQSLKISQNDSSTLNTFTIVPFTSNLNSNQASSNQYWWIISEIDYTTGDINNELTSINYYDHEFNNINNNDFKLPSICPPKDKCVHPR